MTSSRLVACVDVGSTFTKALLVDTTSGAVLARAESPTTTTSSGVDGPGGSGGPAGPGGPQGRDVLDGVDACLAQLGERSGWTPAYADVLACSSAGGGLRIAVVGNEALVTAEAGRRVALSSGGKVVAVVAAGGTGHDGSGGPDFVLTDLAEPDVVLLTGGTDGGNGEVIVAAARRLVDARWRGPVVVAGNRDARGEVASALGEVPHVVADNVVPRIGVLAPDSARAAVREMFLAHVIGGKHLSTRPEFLAVVRGATPDVVLTGVEVLAAEAGDVVVVDVGGATTDVHSVVDLDPEDGALARDVVAPTAVTRTVEGDLGMRWSATSTVGSEEAVRADTDQVALAAAAAVRVADPAYLPESDAERDDDEAIAAIALGLALRRHAGRSRVVVGPDGRVVERSGRDLREVTLLVGSGGVLRHGRPGVADRVLAGSTGPGRSRDDGWQLPERARVVVDGDYVLAAVGLLASAYPEAAHALARSLLG